MENKDENKLLKFVIDKKCDNCEDVDKYKQCCDDTVKEIIEKDKILKESVKKLSDAGIDLFKTKKENYNVSK